MKSQSDRLVEELKKLSILHRELAKAASAKLDAMKKADSKAIAATGARENQVVLAIRAYEQRRREITDALVAEQGFPTEAGARISDLAGCIGEPHASQILALAASIRQSMSEVQRVNRVNHAVVSHVQRCFGDALAAFSRSPMDAGTYGRSGERATASGLSFFSATG
jgi:dUTPase